MPADGPIVNLDHLMGPFSPPFTDLTRRLRYWAEAQPDEYSFYYLVDGEGQEIRWTYAQLDEQARKIAARLLAMGMRGQRALLLYPPGLEFVAAFFGCHYAGSIPVPAYPPRRNRNMGRIQAISEDAEAKVALSVREVIDRVDGMLDDAPSLKAMPWLATEEIPLELAGDWVPPEIDTDGIALLQYTSGSTGSPKGVVLTHSNIMHNCEIITSAFECGRNGGAVSWLPTYHDMGLVGGVLNPVFVGRPSVLMSPVAFLGKPIRWLQAIAKYGATISGGPNFAFQLCAERIEPADCEGLDLSKWEVAFNGAEPVRAETLDAFSRKFAPFGFRANAHYPCYGMAETTLIVTGGDAKETAVTRWFDGPALDQHRIQPSKKGENKVRELVGCGRILPGEKLLIVDPETKLRTATDRIGEIWIQSKCVGRGYWNKPEITAETFHAKLADAPEEGNFLRTGDLGFVHEGELFVAGRLKDLIIVRGVNRYPQDIEETVENSSNRLRSSCAGAFAIDHEGQERLIVVCEVERGRNSQDWSDVIESIRRNVAAEHELPPDAVLLVRSGSVPKTSSGKIQRHACRQAFLDGKLLEVSRWCVWEQVQEQALEHTSTADLVSPDGAMPSEVDAKIMEIVMQQVREVAKERAREMNPDTNIVVDLGLDSLERLQIANSLEEAFGGRFPDDVLQEIETVAEVAQAIREHIGDELIDLAEVSASRRLNQPAKDLAEIPESYYQITKMPEYIRLQRTRGLMAASGTRDPFFSVHEGVIANRTVIGGRELVSFSSYNYLGLSGHPEVTQGAKDAVDQYGTSVSASRLVSGEKKIHREFEAALRDFFGFGDVITFPGGHATNETVIGHLFGAGDLIIHDALAHNSIIQGAMLSGARRRPFEHNNFHQLDEILSEIRGEYRRVLIAIEGLYSMDGDYPNLPEFVKLKRKHKAMLYVDEAHSMGTLGKSGRGVAEMFGLNRNDADLWMGTLSKSFGSCGGFVGSSKEMIDYLRYTTPGYVFANGIPPAATGAALAAIRLLQREPQRVEQLHHNCELFLELTKSYGLNTGLAMGTAIVPVITGSSLAALRLSESLFKQGINAQPILHPAVEEERARVRFFLTSCHTDEELRDAAQKIAKCAYEIDPALAPQYSS